MPDESSPVFDRAAYGFDLPADLIAQEPAQRREESRLLVVDGDTQDSTAHATFRDLPNWLGPDDMLVVNTTAVRPARIEARRPTGARIEILLVSLNRDTAQALLKSSRPVRDGDELEVALTDGSIGRIIVRGEPGPGGIRELELPGAWLTVWVLDELGVPPLPPYIRRNRDDPRLRTLDRDRYRTVFAMPSEEDREFSVAAPTAGLHFTPGLLDEIRQKTAGIEELTLGVGLGTFQPVRADDIREHPMHAEHFRISADTISRLKRHRANGGRVVAVGTTTARVLETMARLEAGRDVPANVAVTAGGGSAGETSIFIHPPDRPIGFDGLITNFHLPESTLVMLVAAILGRERTLAIYADAVQRGYRFFSYGDAMFIRRVQPS